MGEFYFEHKSTIRIFLITAFIAYIASMLFYPFYSAEGCMSDKWFHVQKVWDRWQTFNVGVIALFSSVLALETTIYAENQQRKRNFQAAKAFLPDALSDLTAYYRWSAATYVQVWYAINGLTNSLSKIDQTRPTVHRSIFVECIRYAEPELAQYLSNILALLQVHNSRLDYSCSNAFKQGALGKDNLVRQIIRLAELHALTAELFGFARGEATFNNAKLTLADFQNSYSSLNINPYDYEFDGISLEASTKEFISKNY